MICFHLQELIFIRYLKGMAHVTTRSIKAHREGLKSPAPQPQSLRSSIMAEFIVSSVQTKYIIVSTGKEKSGDRVQTVPDSDKDLNTIVVTITPPPVSPNDVSTVKGKNGLFIAVDSDKSGQYLVWSSKPFEWRFAPNGPPGSLSISVPGVDLYWFDKSHVGIGPHIVLKPGKDAQEHEIFFNVDRLFPQ
ncbi:hypothetical protein AX14_014282 [Amanita brunnescens Koide BX004]|nr:hypothetical protein AX14_014282 [Amanita brunnescens Koide BX004]